jgi:hypothetical protein
MQCGNQGKKALIMNYKKQQKAKIAEGNTTF